MHRGTLGSRLPALEYISFNDLGKHSESIDECIYMHLPDPKNFHTFLFPPGCAQRFVRSVSVMGNFNTNHHRAQGPTLNNL
jgi:hypothetical protein